MKDFSEKEKESINKFVLACKENPHLVCYNKDLRLFSYSFETKEQYEAVRDFQIDVVHYVNFLVAHAETDKQDMVYEKGKTICPSKFPCYFLENDANGFAKEISYRLFENLMEISDASLPAYYANLINRLTKPVT